MNHALGTLVFLAVLLRVAPANGDAFWNWHEAPCGNERSLKRGSARIAKPCTLSITFSPYHLGYPVFLASIEVRAWDKLGIGLDNAIGGYRGGLVGQWGARLPFYPVGTFRGGLQLGPFARMTKLHLPTSSAIAPPDVGSPHSVTKVTFLDIEIARANGRDAAFVGLLVGGKFVVGARNGEVTWLRGFTVQAGFLIGYHFLLGPSRFGPHPLATQTTNDSMGQLYADAGWSF
jgi:hypothetical protein